MSAAGSPPPETGVWIAHYSPEGRPFWNHSITKQSVWEKPTELKTPVEREMERTPWKEYETGGRKYWVHAEDGTTTWDMPQILQEILSRAASTLPAPAASLPSAPSFLPQSPALTSQTGALAAPGSFSAGPPALSRPSFSLQQTVPDFQTHKDAERAFMDMLKRLNVTSEWTWERTMRETVMEPMYKALKTLAERKAAWEKFVGESVEREEEERKASLERCKKDWNRALEKLGGGPEREDGVKSWWRWETMGKKELERRMNPDVWDAPRNDEERKTLFEDFVQALKVREATKKRVVREKNMEKVTSILQTLSLNLAGGVRWKEAQSTIFRTPEWQHDTELQKIEPVDVLAIFEEEVRKAEKDANDIRQRAAEQKRRRARKAREDFVDLLTELKAAGHITTYATWKSIYPLLEADERYQNLLGTPGSSPLDLFWDVVDALDCQAEEDQRAVEGVLEERKHRVGEETTYEEFGEFVEGHERMKEVDYVVLKAAYDKLHGRASRQAKEDRRKTEKNLRLQIDDLRYAYKKLDPPVDLEATYEEVLPRIQEAPEFKIIEDEAARRTAFDKFVKRQKEKVKERELDALESEKRREKDACRSSHRDPDRHDRDRERDSKHRDGESVRSSGRRGGERERDRKSRERSLGAEESKVKRSASEEMEGAPRSKVVKREEVTVLKAEDRDVEMKDVGGKELETGEVEEGEIE